MLYLLCGSLVCEAFTEPDQDGVQDVHIQGRPHGGQGVEVAPDTKQDRRALERAQAGLQHIYPMLRPLVGALRYPLAPHADHARRAATVYSGAKSGVAHL